jgi:uncharacterized protein (UPF0276 family)
MYPNAPLSGTGIGLRHCHYRDFQGGRPAVDFIEVHSENYFGAGGRDLHVLSTLRADYPVSLHGVGLALGSVPELAQAHLDKLARLIERIEPAQVSEHLCWAAYSRKSGPGHAAGHWNDLLPLPYTDEALDLMAARIEQVQGRLKRRILVENVSSYVEFAGSEYGELEFINALAQRTGCGVLLDLNNLHVNAVNHGIDAYRALQALDPRHVGEIHLAGHFKGEDCLIDDHGARVADPVWRLYEHYVTRHGAVPTLIEWDTAIPALPVLLEEADKARAIARPARPGSRTPAGVAHV